MKKIVVILGAVALFNIAGCATHEYVRSQFDPLAERIDANTAAIKQANDKAQQALNMANKMADNAKKSEAAAKEADKAAMEAQKMEKKSEKIFKLEQQK
jgi:hypothetical protein